MQCGYFMPLAEHKLKQIKISLQDKFTVEPPILNQEKPFLHLITDDCTVKKFLDAVKNKDDDNAKVFISKSYIGQFDVDELKECFSASGGYTSLIKAEFTHKSDKCKTNSILVINPEQKNSIIHLHMVQEPDNYGKWKIYGIERE